MTVQPAVADGEAREALLACIRHDTSGGLVGVDELLRGGQLFEMVHGDDVLMRYVLTVQQHEHGREGIIVAAAGSAPGHDLTAAGLAAIELQLAECDAVACLTRRRGLVKKLAAHGFGIDGFVMRKRLKARQ